MFTAHPPRLDGSFFNTGGIGWGTGVVDSPGISDFKFSGSLFCREGSEKGATDPESLLLALEDVVPISPNRRVADTLTLDTC